MIGSDVTAQTPASDESTDPYLAFGLIGVPGAVARPVTAQLEGHGFRAVDCRTASSILEGLALLQWIRAGVVGLVGGVAMFLTRSLTDAVRWIAHAVILTGMMWLPFYMLLLAVLWQLFRRVDADEPVTIHGTLLLLLRRSPLLAFVIAAIFAIAFA
jgi:hypothetical protein